MGSQVPRAPAAFDDISLVWNQHCFCMVLFPSSRAGWWDFWVWHLMAVLCLSPENTNEDYVDVLPWKQEQRRKQANGKVVELSAATTSASVDRKRQFLVGLWDSSDLGSRIFSTEALEKSLLTSRPSGTLTWSSKATTHLSLSYLGIGQPESSLLTSWSEAPPLLPGWQHLTGQWKGRLHREGRMLYNDFRVPIPRLCDFGQTTLSGVVEWLIHTNLDPLLSLVVPGGTGDWAEESRSKDTEEANMSSTCLGLDEGCDPPMIPFPSVWARLTSCQTFLWPQFFLILPNSTYAAITLPTHKYDKKYLFFINFLVSIQRNGFHSVHFMP